MTILGRKIELNQWQKHYFENWALGSLVILIIGNAIYYGMFWELVGIFFGVPIVGWVTKLVWIFLKTAYYELKEEFKD